MKAEAEMTGKLLTIAQLKVGQSWSESITITQKMVSEFIFLTNDSADVHIDKNHAESMGFKDVIVHGFLVSSGYSRILGMFLPGSNTVIHRFELEMHAPVYIEDNITYTVEVDKIIEAVNSVQLRLYAKNQNGTLVNKGKAICVFRILEKSI